MQASEAYKASLFLSPTYCVVCWLLMWDFYMTEYSCLSCLHMVKLRLRASSACCTLTATLSILEQECTMDVWWIVLDELHSKCGSLYTLFLSWRCSHIPMVGHVPFSCFGRDVKSIGEGTVIQNGNTYFECRSACIHSLAFPVIGDVNRPLPEALGCRCHSQ